MRKQKKESKLKAALAFGLLLVVITCLVVYCITRDQVLIMPGSLAILALNTTATMV